MRNYLNLKKLKMMMVMLRLTVMELLREMKMQISYSLSINNNWRHSKKYKLIENEKEKKSFVMSRV